jgi:predicted ATP-grasp superfamily ATP-dependent carboligase
VQRRVVGPGVGLFFLVHGGRVVATFAHCRLREKPPAGGVSVYAESVAFDPELRRRSIDLLRHFEWEGVAMVEYKLDAATGTRYLMEINGRFWGSLQLAIDAGVDFPRLLVESALGGEPAGEETYRIGLRSRWWWGDVDHLLMRLMRSPAQLNLPPHAPSRWRAILDFASSWRPRTRDAVFRLGDLGPFVFESRQWFRRLV